MSLEEIRARAQKSERKVQRRNLWEYVGAIVVVVGVGRTAIIDSSTAVRAGAGLVMLATAYVVYRLYKRGSMDPLPAGLALTSSLDFYRGELVRQRDLLEGVWSWYLLPFVPGVATILIGRAVERPDGWLRPLLTAAALVVMSTILVRKNARAARKIQGRIDELDRAR